MSNSLSQGLPPVPEVIFTNWREILNCAPIAYPLRRDYIRAIEAYLDYCRHNGLSITKQSARDFMGNPINVPMWDLRTLSSAALNPVSANSRHQFLGCPRASGPVSGIMRRDDPDPGLLFEPKPVDVLHGGADIPG